jgi:CelD/BcsL family acetyltransferase involved in cellulose biosynthesis
MSDMAANSPDPCPAPLRVLKLSTDDARWARFVAEHPDALVYHHPAWFQVLHEAFGYEAAAIGVADPVGGLSGILPMMRKKSLLAKVHYSSLPHTPVAGPLAIDEPSMRALLSAGAALVDTRSAYWLQLKVPGPGLDKLANRFTCSRWDSTYVLDLPDDPAQLQFGTSKNHARIRWAARKSSKLGVIVREASGLQDIRQWYRLYLETVRAHATPPRPFRLFELMWEHLAPEGLLRLLLAEKHAGGRKQLLAGSLFFGHKHTVSYAYNGRDRTQLGFRPNDAIHWHAITQACREGFRRYDFGEVTAGNTGLIDFKEKWGAKPVSLYRCYYPRERELERGVLAPSGARAVAEWGWRRLPLPITSGAGKWIYRCL